MSLYPAIRNFEKGGYGSMQSTRNTLSRIRRTSSTVAQNSAKRAQSRIRRTRHMVEMSNRSFITEVFRSENDQFQGEQFDFQ